MSYKKFIGVLGVFGVFGVMSCTEKVTGTNTVETVIREVPAVVSYDTMYIKMVTPTNFIHLVYDNRLTKTYDFTTNNLGDTLTVEIDKGLDSIRIVAVNMHKVTYSAKKYKVVNHGFLRITQ